MGSSLVKIGDRGGTKMGIEVTGFEQTMKALKALEPDVFKALNKRINTQLKRVARGAAGRSGGTYKTTRRMASTKTKAAGGSVWAAMGQKGLDAWKDPQSRAVIMEFAKKPTAKNPKPQQTQAMLNTLAGGLQPGRYLWAEWDSGTGRAALKDIEDGVRDAERTLQRNLDAAGETY